MALQSGAPSFRGLFDRARLAQAADWLAVAVVASLPWSTTVTGVLIALWLVVLIGTLDVRDIIRSLRRPAAALPLAFCALAVLGMLWSVAPINEQLSTLKSLSRLSVIPLLLWQFSRSDKGQMALYAFLASCTLLMMLSWLIVLFPALQFSDTHSVGVPVKDYIVQSGEFLLCAFALIYLSLNHWQANERMRALALAGLALAFLANITLVATSRTSVAVFFVLLVLFAVRRLNRRGAVAALLAGLTFAAAAAALSPYLRVRVLSVIQEVQEYRLHDAETSTGYRLEFWKKSTDIIAQAPVLGHGIGSIEEMFRRAAVGQTGMAATVTSNPHNQILVVAIQLGFVGVLVLCAMWIAHALLFWRPGFAAWVGLAVVAQNVVSSMSNAQLFYFTPGWLYVFGVGMIGGMVLREAR